MKIIYLTGEFAPFQGGIGTYVREMAEAAASQGHDVTVAAPNYGSSVHVEDDSYPFRVLRYAGGEYSARQIPAKWYHTGRLAHAEKFDVVHAVDWSFYLPLALSAFRWRSRCILTFHGSEISGMSRISRRLVLRLVGFWSGWALMIANSRFTADRIRSKFPSQPTEKIRFVPLGVSARPFAVISREDARVSLGIEQNEFVVLSLGRVVPRKGHHITLEAISSLSDRKRMSYLWYIVGAAGDPAYLSRITSSLAGSGVRSVRTGSVSADRLELIFSAADVLCVPGVWGYHGEVEGFGLVYLEAGLREIPSIGANIGGTADAVVDGETGILIEPGDSVALAAALERLRVDVDFREQLSGRALEYAKSHTWTRVVEKTYDE